MRSSKIPLCTLLTILTGLSAPFTAHADTITGLEFLGQANFPARTVTVDGTILGGLSGIRYDAANNRYVANSDDRGNLPGVDAAAQNTQFLVFAATTVAAPEPSALTLPVLCGLPAFVVLRRRKA